MRKLTLFMAMFIMASSSYAFSEMHDANQKDDKEPSIQKEMSNDKPAVYKPVTGDLNNKECPDGDKNGDADKQNDEESKNSQS